MRVIFWINKGSAIYCRITIAGQRAEISTGLKSRVLRNGRTGDSVTDTRLAEMEFKLRKVELMLEFKGEPYTAVTVKQTYEAEKPKPQPIPRLLDIMLEKDKIYMATITHLKEFLGKRNPMVSELDQAFADRLANHLLKNHKTSTVKMYFSKVRASLAQIMEEMPFLTPEVLAEDTSQGDGPKYLTLEQYNSLKLLKLSETEAFYRYCFFWQCETGMSMSDMNVFDGKIDRMITGDKYLSYQRVKTGVKAIVPGTENIGILLRLFPLTLNERTYNKHLKAMGTKIGFNNMTSHNGRHTFGVLQLIHGYSMESVRKMMGHSSILTTEKVYAEITLDKLFTEQRNHAITSN